MSDQPDEIKYLDFELTIARTEADEYIARARSGKGKAEVRFHDPFNQDKRQVVKSTLTAAALRSSAVNRKAKMRGATAPEVREMKKFGSLLFQEAVNGAVRDFYQKCRGQADRESCGIRLRLSLDQSVDELPWEFLCVNDDFVALNPRSPVVRYIEGAASSSLVKVEDHLRVLVVIAKPSDEVPLDTDAEKESITAALKPLTDEGAVRLTFIEGNNTWEKLMNALLPNRTHILHFIGHGAFDEKNGEGVLLMADADGNTMVVDSERLRVLVQGKSRLALVVLNSCLGAQGDDAQPFSSVGAGLVKSGIPAVIAMQFEISDDAARAIAETFYTSLALNMPVDAALTEARRRIFLSDRNSLEWATPILYMQVPDGQLFAFKGPRPQTKPPTPPPIETDTFKVNAAQRYAEGELAMARQDWAAAVTAFRGAMVYVPDFRDAREKLSTCATRANAATLRQRVEHLIATHNYDEVLPLLEDLGKADPDQEMISLREKIECGQKYQRAIAALEMGDRAAGASLLRDVIIHRPDFEDAAERLKDLAADGDGLLGTRPAPMAVAPRETAPGTQSSFAVPELAAGWNKINQWWNARPETPAPPVEPGAPANAEKKGFSWREYDVRQANPRQLAEEMRLYLHDTGCEHQVVQQKESWIVQGRKPGQWRDLLGMAQAATILIEPVADGLKVSIGGAKWIDKAAGAATGMILGFTWITSIIGFLQQESFVDGLWQIAERYARKRGGKQIRFG